MMQNLSDSYPSLTFILNQAWWERYSAYVITSETWADQTFISPTVSAGSYDRLPLTTQLAIWNRLYPNRVLLHLDAFAQSNIEPMGIFAEQNRTTETRAIYSLVSNGYFLAAKNEGYGVLYPIIGAWTYLGALLPGQINYQGTLQQPLRWEKCALDFSRVRGCHCCFSVNQLFRGFQLIFNAFGDYY